ncbi:chorismate-binding protein [Streptomyces sp. M10(2022)]
MPDQPTPPARPADDLAYYRRLRRLNPRPTPRCCASAMSLSSAPRPSASSRSTPTAPWRPNRSRGRPPPPGPAHRRRCAPLLQTDPKTRAENLMIVDLLRNDLGQICEVGTVAVPPSWPRSHTPPCTNSSPRSPARCARAVRPWTRSGLLPRRLHDGAPKLRTMEIIDALEGEARGVYSGAIGFVGYTGTADLSITIRTAVSHDGELTIGAGGAIVLDSDPEAEYEEMLLKARATLRALP